MLDATSKPLVFDADNGGQLEHLPYLVRSLERAGTSAIIMEDKIGLKRNSLFKNQTGAKQDKPNIFANKIKKVCNTRQSDDFMVIARIESFILGNGIEDAINHINEFSTNHTDSIITENKEIAEKFMREIDSAIVMHNASTQFADGGEFGMGAEIGIATGRFHARGPVGVEQLTSFKYVVRGSGQTRP